MNPHGTPIWYELLTPDHGAAKAFYDAVVGWSIGPKPPGDVDYRMIQVGDGQVGGAMALTDAMAAGGAQPGWLMYVGVEDVDSAADAVSAAGGAVLMAPFDVPQAGRMALCADPQGAPFYVMRGGSPADSTAFAPERDGHAAWNELWTNDAPGAVGFYQAVFGWENRETMNMGPMGGYHFLDLGDVRIGAVARSQAPGQAPRWNIYFRVADLDGAIARATAAGASITMGPHDVPGNSRIVMGTDPQGATFALVSPAKES